MHASADAYEWPVNHDGNWKSFTAGLKTTVGAGSCRSTVVRPQSMQVNTEIPEPCSKNVRSQDAQCGHLGRNLMDMRTSTALAGPRLPPFLLAFPLSYRAHPL